MAQMKQVMTPAERPHQDLRVANTTPVPYLATSIVKHHEEGKRLTLSCIGVQPVNQAAKAVAAARGKVASQGMTIVMEPFFVVTRLDEIEGAPERTVLRFNLHFIPTASL